LKAPFALLALLLAACQPSAQTPSAVPSAPASAFETAKENSVTLRSFLTDFPKGADLHSHLVGAIYAESFIGWAAEDGWCVARASMIITPPDEDGCARDGLIAAADVLNDVALREDFIHAASVRDFAPSADRSWHEDFFSAFPVFIGLTGHFGDMIAEVTTRSAHQNIAHLELMHIFQLGEVFAATAGVALSGDAAADYALLMSGPLGEAMPEMVANAKIEIDRAMARRAALQKCAAPDPEAGCNVSVLFIHTVLRDKTPAEVFGQIIFGWALMAADDRVAGLNLVTPENWRVPVEDYTQHMQQIDHLYKTLGEQNVALHACAPISGRR